ncbi:XVIPCD domain-containing protein [uncultured Stenotrophomonas sp.]|uniref:XVIPCD domain-containing protein n=1 Tax=uncultured Stenotrophomonas sp. TaxID=165438 RepID=UPI0025E855D9|nr:XVIPCD domain-containing protein [uncultured Stenotrophomonas sp.]
MSGLTRNDLDILTAYAEAGNRELYFNYLAHKEGSDGYALLALGVVRNDNIPGATANTFANRQALADGVNMSESQWQEFGVTLMRHDLALRKQWFTEGRPDLALNLPVLDVRDSHDLTFDEWRVDRSGWTPYKLLEAARAYGGEPEAEAAWKMLLDNRNLGLDRGAQTSMLVLRKYRDHLQDPDGYLREMADARAPHGLIKPVTNLDPDRVRYDGNDYVHGVDGWRQKSAELEVGSLGPTAVHVRSPPASDLKVTNPETLRYLDDARATRQLREELRQQFHPEDPNRDRPIMRSPEVLSDAAPLDPQPERPLAAAVDPTSPQHPRHALYAQCVAGVQGLDAQVGKTWDRHSECMAASLTTLAAGQGLQRVDHVLLNGPAPGLQPGQNVFVVQGEPSDPAHLRTQMPTAQALATPPEQSFQQLAVNDQRQAQEQEQALQRSQEEQLQPARAAPVMQA